MILPTTTSDEHLVLYDISWDAYEQLLGVMQERRLRHSYNAGTFEIMSPGKRHDRDKSFLGRLIEATALEWDIDVDAIGSTTLRNRLKGKGLEPDECYYVAHAEESRLRNDYDPDRDPPPDLAVEVDVTNSSVDRLSIYADLGVPEVWRLQGETLTFLRRNRNGKYVPMASSLAFPGLTSQILETCLQRRAEVRANVVVREFIAWLHSQRG